MQENNHFELVFKIKEEVNGWQKTVKQQTFL